MKNRFYKFLVMLTTVILLGSGATMLNLHLQKSTTKEEISFRSYAMDDAVMKTEASAQETSLQSLPQETTSVVFLYEESCQETLINEDIALTETLGSDQADAITTVQESAEDVISQKSPTDEKEMYYARLQDMERVYTARMNAVSKEALAEQQKTAEELLEIWDDELNAIYQKLRKSLSKDEFYLLRNEERAWIRNRDAAANRAAAKDTYSNSTQKLAYTNSLLQWTKERVYELATMYYGN